MKWRVILHPAFDAEFNKLNHAVQDELLAHAILLEHTGPNLGRPYVDTLKGSRFKNMKELRFKANQGIWRVAFAYDKTRNAILLVAGNKAGKNERLFYKQLINKADKRFSLYLNTLTKE